MSDIFQYLETTKQFIVDNFLFGGGAKITNDTPLFEK